MAGKARAPRIMDRHASGEAALSAPKESGFTDLVTGCGAKLVSILLESVYT